MFKKVKRRYGAAALAVICLLFVWGTAVFAQEGATAEEKDLSVLLEAAAMTKDGADLFDGVTRPFDGGNLEVKLMYDVDKEDAPVISEGDVLSVQLVPTDTQKDFIQIDYPTSQLRILEDEGIKLADLDLTGRKGVVFTFADIQASFTAKLNMPFVVNKTRLVKYFQEHPDEENVEFQYTLQYNDSDTGKMARFSLQKPEIQPAQARFVKTRGIYEQSGDLGQGNILYNIFLGTELNRMNEFVIYDTPDVNIGFDGNMKVYIPTNYGNLDNVVLQNGNYYAEPGNMDDESKMEIYIYDLYYLTEEANAVSMPRQAGYTEEYVTFSRRDITTGADSIKSMEAVTVPKNILLEKPAGEELTEAEKQLIDANGGLYKKVGKGFKIRIKNFKGNQQDPGGYLTFVYTLNIKNNSPKVDENKFPIYLNTGSYYAQEIPTCTADDENCVPIKNEKTQLDAVLSGNYTTEGKVTPGNVSAEVDKFSRVEFQKVAEDDKGLPNMSKPLEGAVFTIYKVDEDGSKEVAHNKDHIKMENLVTNKDGILCEDVPEKTVINLQLERGNYIFEEISAPAGYEIETQETAISVGLLNNRITVANRPKEEQIVPPSGGKDKSTADRTTTDRTTANRIKLTDNADGKAVKTGDNTDIYVWFILGIAAVIVFIILYILNGKKKK